MLDKFYQKSKKSKFNNRKNSQFIKSGIINYFNKDYKNY